MKIELFLAIAILFIMSFVYADTANAQIVHCTSGALGCAVDRSQSNPSSCSACPDPDNINSCCASQSSSSCASVICEPLATNTPTPPSSATNTPTPPAEECSPGDDDNCDSGAGCFKCEWHEGGIGCMADISEGWMCNPNYGHRDSVCQQFDNRDDCLGCGYNLLCQEENESVGYRCEGTTFGCFPCFQEDVDNGVPGCDPPEYDNSDDCEDACSGTTPTYYSCVDGECVESGSSDQTWGQCLTECNLAPSPLGAGACSGEGIYTAIGCIPISSDTEFIAFILRWSIGIAGGFALLLIVYSGVQIITAGGNPQKVQSGKELLTAAIAGFLFLLLAVYLLQFIGIRLLEIPGF